MTSYLLEKAWVDGRVRDAVRVEIEDGRFTSVTWPDVSSQFSGVAMPEKGRDPRLTGDSCTPVRGLTLPGFANAHSHAFHRALRGRTQRGQGTFWTWRDRMYDLAGRLDPDTYYALARAAYREMVAAGFTGVGEFHYLHHRPDGGSYDDPNVMGQALLAAARDAGIRITLLDTLYLSSGFGKPIRGVQRRYDDGDVDRWASRVAALAPEPNARLGAAIHSVRAVPKEQLTAAAALGVDRALHVHLSEQVAENDQCLAHYGVTPTQLLADAGVLGPTTTAVHATHLTDDDVALLRARCGFVCMCPTTERDLGDGIGPTHRFREVGVPLTIGSDSHAVVDPFEEMRAIEMDERLATRARGGWTAAALLAAGTETGHESLDWPDAGSIAVGQRADLVTLDTRTSRTAGTGADEHTAVFAATAADVRQVVVDGRVVFDGDHASVGRELEQVIEVLWS